MTCSPLRTALALAATALAVVGTAAVPAQAAVAPGTPIGALDTAVGDALPANEGNLHLTGWTVDGDAPGTSLFVDFYVDGAGAGRFTANGARPDLAALAPGNHGFDYWFNVPQGTHTVCAYGIGVGPGGAADRGNSLLGCKQAVVRRIAAGNPVGALDTAVDGHGLPATTGNLHVTGWSIDGDEPTSHTFVDLYVDGAGAARVIADAPRPDLAALAAGDHGFDAFLNVAPGRHTVCAYAIGIGPGGPPDGANPTLGCEQVVVARGGEPFGALDVALAGPCRADLRGWAVDPDAPTAPIGIDVYVDPGTLAATGFPFPQITTGSRPDLPAAFPGVGPDQGFAVSVPLAAGRHQVCVYAINRSGTPGTNSVLNCASVTV